ncbi:4F5 domain protein [Metarhizium guizhouense ARSEF 977]|uniref:4F5 domain protein n=1 Tax=Metarhizium guizhouense (strain ARSEF 977) TaxID=1276136 RepID=A0A0B4HKZ0_METGA|nr:4F5 domain protein [Metarhizium guizhouense ARSEF 977]
MARGNQRDKAREANLKKQAAQKKGNNMTGTEMQRAKESAAEIMRQKQAAGTTPPPPCHIVLQISPSPMVV